MTHGIILPKSMCPKIQDERTHMSMIPYASAIGSIMYAMLCTRLDVSYALSVMSRYQSDPSEGHLRKTKDLFLIYGDGDLIVSGYIDVGFKYDRNDLKSQFGYVFTLNSGAIGWKSFEQDTTMDSTIESKYIEASKASMEVFWMRMFISKLGMVPSILIHLYCDNNGAITQAKVPWSNQRSKQLFRRYHLIR